MGRFSQAGQRFVRAAIRRRISPRVLRVAQREPVAELAERWIDWRAYPVSRAIPEAVLLP